ncbi:scavenger receptor cysteine-rich domain-containing protein DMBT1-like [Diadema setosum]|uniref:scavenger receptor cysteine-rich domain-containing protein DMBT1-like n=1 Tax=Diadema setosum TaxID=31175 RepID=UPI003B3A544A
MASHEKGYVIMCYVFFSVQYSFTDGLTTTPTVQNNVRLVGGNSMYEGRVEVYYDGVWGTVCDDGWDDLDARVVCRQLGYSVNNAKAMAGGTYGGGSGPILLNNVNCFGWESSLASCSHNGWYSHDCTHFEDAGVRCEVNIRLVGGSSLYEGRVEVYHNGAWGTVCDDSWDDNDAKVVCRELGYPTTNAEAMSRGTYGQGLGPILLDNVGCIGWEPGLSNCSSNGWYNHDCQHDEDAGVRCDFLNHPTPPLPIIVYLRLVGGSSLYEGRVELYYGGAWGTVCHDSWDENDAQVVCRQLGFSTTNAEALGSATYGEGSGSILLDNVGCYGWESSLANCSSIGWYNHNCGHDNDASVRCGVNIRLVGGSWLYEGRVEVYYAGVWGTICDNGWDENDAAIVCRQLGYPTTSAEAFGGATYGEGSGSIFLENLGCNGWESSLTHCSSNGWQSSNCGHHEDAGVRCESSIRLAEGSSLYEGRVEVYYDGAWGTVCDDNWDNNDAQVVCRQLGHPTTNAEAFISATYGEGSGSILLDNVACYGWELNLTSCFSSGWYNHNCGHHEDAGVRCVFDVTTPSLTVSIRLVGGSSLYEGRVEVYYGGAWGTVCDDGWDDNDAQVVCRQLGYPTTNANAVGEGTFGEGSGFILLDEVECYGRESSLGSCHSKGWYNNDYVFDITTPSSIVNIRLVGGSLLYEGRVEVYYNGAWGTVCDNGWDDYDAEVVCRQLGYPTTNAEAVGEGTYGEGSGPILLDNVGCHGWESSLSNCSSNGWYNHDCEHYDDAGVRCVPNIRLVGGNSMYEGRIEVYYNGAWGTVCDDGWDDNDAEVVCRQLEYSVNNAKAMTGGTYGRGSGPILLNNVNCFGWESRLASCPHNGWYNHDCTHFEDAGVRCEVNIRLVGGSSLYEGRVEVYHNGAWGTVCDDSWDDNDAKVVCRELGYPTPNAEAMSRGTYGQGSGPILLDNVGCIGLEPSLSNCSSNGWYNHDCQHDEDAGVRCGKTSLYIYIRLVGGRSLYEGRVEVYYGGAWGTVCDDGWDDNDAQVVCRQLEFSTINAEALGSATYGEGSGSILLDNVGCYGWESNLANCSSIGWYIHNCGHDEDASVRCGVNIRLVGGSWLYEGRVEVYYGGAWGTICDNGWDENDAQVVCRQLGYSTTNAEAFLGATYGEGSGSISLENLGCNGWESSLTHCTSNGWQSSPNCGHHENAGVRCEASIRLAGGSSLYEGRVEVYHNGAWGTVCDDNWDNNDAQVVCRQLGHPTTNAEAFIRATYGEGSGSILLDNVGCYGWESKLSSCFSSGWYNHNCGHHEDAGVRCVIIRLVGGTSLYEGRVEVYYDGAWGTVCDDGWDDNDAEVVCRQLGYPTTSVEAVGGGTFGEGSGFILLDEVECYGWETSLDSCHSKEWLINDCKHNEDAGVRCVDVSEVNTALPEVNTALPIVSIRLVGGSSLYEGRIEVYYAGAWGTVCDDGWDDNDAQVVCRQLGYPTNNAKAVGGGTYGEGSGFILLDDVGCYGWESSLVSCHSKGWYNNDCKHYEDAGVRCVSQGAAAAPPRNWIKGFLF